MIYPLTPLRAADVGGEVCGDADAVATFAAGLGHATADSLVFYSGGDAVAAAAIPAAILLVRPETAAEVANFAARAVVACPNPMARFCEVIGKDYENVWRPALSDPAKAFQKAKISPRAHLEEGVSVGQGTEIFPGAILHAPARIGAGCRIQANAVIGAVGLAYAQEDGEYAPRFIHLGGVDIGNHVDIGANTTIVKGILQDTVIGKGTKIGNNVNIGHNVTVGENCFISSGATLCGSVVVEDSAWIAPGALVLNGVKVAARCQLGLGAVVSKDTEPDGVYLGYPARRIGERKG